MGLRNSKSKRNSYDIAAVVSNKDFTYKKHERPLPKIELPIKTDIIGSNELEEITTSTATASEIETNGTAVVAEVKESRDPAIPHWVNENNFKSMLLKTYPNIKEVIEFKAYPALAAGENFATLMLRVKINVKFQDDTSKDFSFMLKVPHETKVMQEMMQAVNLFTIENTMYTDVLPELEEMYRQAGVEVKLGANSYRLELEDSNINYVLLEDLSVDAFKNAKRLECLDMEHTLSVLRKMAQFHAATACRVAKKGSYPAIFSPDIDNEIARAFCNQMFMSFKKPFLDNLKTYENGEKYYDLMDNFFDNITELFVRGRKLVPIYFCALNHGDAWCNNILFKYTDDGRVEELRFVDFQNCSWGSPATDLYYFIFSSVQIGIKLSQFDYFVRYYHEHLSEHLKLLEYPLEIPSLREFHIQMIDFGVMATMTSFLTLSLVLLDPTENAKFENFVGESEESYRFKNSMYTNERYRKYINEILPWLYNRGFMEINLRDIDNKIAVADKLKELELQQIAKQAENIEHSSTFCPEWVNESLCLNVVQADCENFHKILKFAVSPARNSFSSNMLQLDIDIELTDHINRNLSYMLKTPTSGEQAKGVISMLGAFEKELMIYSDIIPKLENIYKQKAGLDVVFAPKSFKLSRDGATDDVLVLENVQTKNFKKCDHLEGLDMQHIEAVLRKLSQFHAASASLFKSGENVLEIYKQHEYAEETSNERKQLLKSYTETYLECVKYCEGNEEYFSKLKTYADNALAILTKASSIDHNKFNVLNHGGCWIKNIMFQHDNEENISNTYFIDFQLAQYGTPCYDLFQFLLSSPKLELKLEYFDYFIRYYHENLKSNLQVLEYNEPIPSLKDLHQELLDNAMWAFYTVLHILPIVLLDPQDQPSLEKIVGVDEDGIAFKKHMFLNKHYHTHIEAMLPWLDRKGLLDFH